MIFLKNNLSVKFIFIWILVVGLFTNSTLAQLPSKNSDTQKNFNSSQKTTLLLGRSVDVSKSGQDMWFGALFELCLEFKLSIYDNFKLIPQDSISYYLPAIKNLQKNISENDYYTIARRFNASHFGIPRFEVIRDKDVQFYLEIVSIADKKTTATIERSFKLSQFSYEIDEIVSQIQKQFKLEIPAKYSRFQRLPSVSENIKNFRQLGECLLQDRYTPEVDKIKVADEYRRICEKDQSLLAAYYRAGFFLQEADKYQDAAEAHYFIYSMLPEYLPIYAPLAKSYRLSKRSEEALKIIIAGESKGIPENDLYIEKALCLESLNRNGEVQEVYAKVLDKDPNEPNALLYYARFNNQLNKSFEAIKFADKLIHKKIKLEKAYIEKGKALVSLRQFEEAILAFNQATVVSSTDPTPYIYLGDLYYSQKKYTRASQNFMIALQLNKEDPSLYIKAAKAFELSGEKKSALSTLKSEENRFNTNAEFILQLGMMEFSNGDSTNAKVHLENAVRAGQNDPTAISTLAFMYENNNDLDKASQYYSRALENAQDKTACKFGLARIHIKKGSHTEAIPLLLNVLASNQKTPKANRFLGDAYFATNDNAAALNAYKKELNLSGYDNYLQERIANIVYLTKSIQEAKAEYQLLLKNGSQSASTYYKLAIISLRLKELGNANNFYTKATKTGPGTADDYFQIGKGYFSLNQIDKSIEAYQLCIKLDPNNELALVGLSDALEKKGKIIDAADISVKLFALNNTKYADKIAHGGILYEKANTPKKAKDAYTQYIQKGFTNTEINIRLAKLEFNDKNYPSVIEALRSVPNAKGNDFTISLILAESYYHNGQYQKAIFILNNLTKKIPLHPKCVELLALCYEKSNSIDMAIVYYKKFLSTPSSSKHLDFAFHLGELYEQVRQITTAKSQYQSNIKSYPKDIRNYERLSRLYERSNEQDKLIALLAKATSLQNCPPILFGMYAKVLVQKGEKEKAALNYNKYLTGFPNDSLAWIESGKLYFSLEKYEKSINAFEHAINFFPQNYEILRLLGLSYIRTSQFDKAIDPLSKANKLHPHELEIFSLLADCYNLTNNKKGLIKILKDWALLDKNNFDIRKQLGGLLLESKEDLDALVIYEEALKLKRCDIDIRLKVASIYESKGSKEKWFSNLKEANNCAPKNGAVLFQLTRYYAFHHENTQIIEYAQKTIEVSPSNAEARFLLGSQLLEKKKYSEALPHLTEACKQKPDNMEYQAVYIEVLYKTDHKQMALQNAKKIISKSKTPSAGILFWTGKIYYEIGSQDSAKIYLNRSGDQDKNCGDCYSTLGIIAFANKDYKETIKNLQKAIDIKGYNESYAVKIAESYSKIGKQSQSREMYEKIISNNKSNNEALYHLVHSYLQDKKSDEAQALISQKSGKKNGWYYLALGELYETQGKTSAALNAYLTASNTIKDNALLEAGCGRMSLASHDYNSAIMYFGRAIADAPDNLQLYIDLGKSYEGIGDYPSAMDLYDEVAQKDPNHPEVFFLKARITSKRQDHTQAITTIKEGIQKNRKNALLYLALGHEYRMTKMHDDAIKAYKKALSLDRSKCFEAYRHLGNLYYYTEKDYKSAKKNFQEYIKAGGQDANVKKLLRKLAKSL